MIQILANGIDLPMVLALGLVVVIPLLFFQTVAEAFVLARVWRLPFRALTRLTLTANVASLLAGIPTKIANAFLYSVLLPTGLPQFFARYPYVIALGTFIYFAVTLIVEVKCSADWVRTERERITRVQIWKGVLIANLATYVVMAPLHYVVTKPTSNVQEYTADARWARSPHTRIVFIDPKTHFLKTQLLGETANHTVVPATMSDFLISSNLDVCVYRSTNGNLCVWRKHPPQFNVLWSAASSISMEQVAFSPSGEFVAFVPDEGSEVHVFDTRMGTRMTQTLGTWIKSPRVAWIPAEARFVVTGNTAGHARAVLVRNGELAVLPHDSSVPVESFPCYSLSARGGARGRFGPPYSDTCGNLKAWASRGLGNHLRIYGENEGGTDTRVTVAANPGLLHLGGLRFTEVVFLDGCNECLFVAEDHIYLLDIPTRRVGSVAVGNHVVPFTPRFLK